MKYLSTFSGIEAATVAWHPLGWEPVGFSEIEPFPSAVLNHHYPHVQNYGDITQFGSWSVEPFRLLVGGSPCQSFSVAGLRKGLADERGNLMLTFGRLAQHYRPQWLVWENVPGVLSSEGGRDFGTFLGMLAEFGYGFAYRVLDAQYFGVAQRRRRVFVVAHLGDWRPAAAVLFDPYCMSGHSAPSREKGKGTAGRFADCFEPRSPDGHARVIGDFAPTLNRMGGGQREPCVITKTFDFQTYGSYGESPVAATLSARDFKSAKDLIAQPMAYGIRDDVTPKFHEELSGTLGARDYKGPQSVAQPIGAFKSGQGAESRSIGWSETTSPTLPSNAGWNTAPAILQHYAVRRLTPIECERLQGFPDTYTAIPWRGKPADQCPDGPRYKALGNSMAVPVMRWIGERIQAVDDMMKELGR